MRITLRRVEEKITDTSAGNVLVLLGDVGEQDARGDFLAGPEKRGLLEVRFAKVGEA